MWRGWCVMDGKSDIEEMVFTTGSDAHTHTHTHTHIDTSTMPHNHTQYHTCKVTCKPHPHAITPHKPHPHCEGYISSGQITVQHILKVKVLHSESHVLGISDHVQVRRLFLTKQVQEAQWEVLLGRGEGGGVVIRSL